MEGIINLLVVMTVLSIGAERFANILKLRKVEPRKPDATEKEKQERDFKIGWRSMACGMFLAVIVKADFFALVNSLEDPFKTLGWVHSENYKWVQSRATMSMGAAAYAFVGCLVTGFGLGFGSSFWHDILGTVRELKAMTRNKAAAGRKVRT